MDSSPPGSSVLRILQARVLERVAIYRDINLYNQICGGLIRYVVAAEDGEDFFSLLFTVGSLGFLEILEGLWN